MLGVRAAVQSLTDALAVDLGFLVVGALVIWAAAGPRRDLGRASDLACVAVVPLLLVDLVGTVVVLALQLEVSRALMSVLSLTAFTWTGILIALGALEARRVGPGREAPLRRGRRAGWGMVAIMLAGVVVQTVWVVRYLDRMRPVMVGDVAPAFELHRIGAKGAPGERFALAEARGKIVVLDFWATWCGPCLKAMPKLEAFQRTHPADVVVVTINIDDPADARTIFDEAGYTVLLLAGDPPTSDRYDVGAIPHTVVIDRAGIVRAVVRGGKVDLEREFRPL
jgi:thiol-disulfide isomerase/thioredoxin